MLNHFQTFKLLQYFSIASFLACSATIFTLSKVNQDQAIHHLVEDSKTRNLTLSQILANSIWHDHGPFLKSSTHLGRQTLLNHVETMEIYESVWKILQGTPITSVKIFATNGRVLFSTEAQQIGRKARMSEGVLSARAGKPFTRVDHEDPFTVLSKPHNNHHHSYEFSTYLPIRANGVNGPVEGVVEVYSDLNALVDKVEQNQKDGLSLLIVSFGLLYGILFVIVYQGDRIIAAQTKARQAAEDELEKKVQQLAQSNAELEQFAYVASHDLQEPLRKIEAFGDRLQNKYRDELGDKGKEYIDRMQNAAGRMRILIQDLLEFSRVSGKAQPFSTVNLEEVLQGVINDLETRIEETGSTIELGALPVLDADPLQMRQLFQNLIGNALKFRRPEEPLKVNIQSRHTKIPPRNGKPKSTETCVITVVDNGIGFEQKYTDRIFKVFQRLHSKSEYAGTGIGLAVCAKIAERHGGSISAESSPGNGATFIITLPLQQDKLGHQPCKLAENPS